MSAKELELRDKEHLLCCYLLSDAEIIVRTAATGKKNRIYYEEVEEDIQIAKIYLDELSSWSLALNSIAWIKNEKNPSRFQGVVFGAENCIIRVSAFLKCIVWRYIGHSESVKTVYRYILESVGLALIRCNRITEQLFECCLNAKSTSSDDCERLIADIERIVPQITIPIEQRLDYYEKVRNEDFVPDEY